ncbi:glycosyltransferase [Pseudooceanicola sp. MF1-13]|uniref:glycosyltransferase n=1 Tax=Pseudooceanicola sp. MF1-13 TaxID=3379095 RepID=UPI003891A13A
MQVIGICRFSYPAIGGFQVLHETAADRAAYLYAPDRMEDRFRTFQAFTLPALRAQTDPDFTFVIVVGYDLAVDYGNRLWDLVEDIPQVVIREYAPGPHREIMKEAINSVRDHDQATLQFRLDDDDAVAVDFVARLKAEGFARADDLQGNRHIAIDFRNGYIASPGADGIHAMETSNPFMTAALAIAFEPGVRSTVMNYSHVKLGKFMQCFAVHGDRMYVRGHNRWNDSRQGDGIQPEDLHPLTPATKQTFRDRFAIDEAEVARLYTT